MGRRDPLPRESLIGVHVLVVDDDPDAERIFRSILEYCGALVTTASSAEEALGVFQRIVPDVAVIDVVLPEHDGYWLLSEMRKLPTRRGGAVPALACTGYGADHSATRLTVAGFQRSLTKPIDPWDLTRAVEALAHREA